MKPKFLIDDEKLESPIKLKLERRRGQVVLTANGCEIVIIYEDGQIITSCAAVYNGYTNAGMVDFGKLKEMNKCQ